MTQPDMNFSGDLGEDTKKALEKYRDRHDLESLEGAVRQLLPSWTFRDDSRLVVFGEPAGFESRMRQITSNRVVFDVGARIELPSDDADWDRIQLQVGEIEPLASGWVDAYLEKSLGEADEWESIQCKMSTVGEYVERVRFWKSIPSAATINEIHIPRSRIQSQMQYLNTAVGKELSDEQANTVVELTERLQKIDRQILQQLGNEQLRRERDVIESEIMDAAPEWLTQARRVESELMWLGKVLQALHPAQRRYK